MTATPSRYANFEAGFGVGNCWAEPLAGIVSCGDQRLHVEPKVMDVLICLARSPGEVVTRDALLSSVWGEVVVTDDVLTRCISELRTLLGDTDRERRFIRTIPKRGYSLIAPVHLSRADFDESLSNPVPTAPERAAVPPTKVGQAGESADGERGMPIALWLMPLVVILGMYFITRTGDRELVTIVDDQRVGQAATPPAGSATAARPDSDAGELPQSLAVLPFVNLSADPTHDFFSDGLSEDIRNGMLTSMELRVSARTSSRAFKDMAIDVREIGRQLEVDALLEGTVRISNGHLRVTTQLTDVADGYPLWAGSYERDLGESISTQVEIAQTIVHDLAPSLIGSQDIHVGAPTNIAAHEYYLLGRHQWHLRTPASLDLAVTYFEDALELDTNYALAYSGLADAHLLSISYAGRPAEQMIDLATGYTERALELGPDLAETHASLGLLYENTGEVELARDAYLRAVELKPQYSMAQMWLGNTLMELRDIESAFRHLSVARELDPLHPQVQFNFAGALMSQGRYEDAKASIAGFLRFRQNELLTDQLLSVDFYTGRYDLMLQNAVGYTYGGTFTPYNSRIVIESLIYLQRFEEAQRMIDDNASGMDDVVSHLLRGELAVARRDATALRGVAAAMLEAAPATVAVKKSSCVGLWADAFRAAADFIDGDYTTSIERFGRLAEPGADSHCMHDFPEGSPTVLTYIAASRLKLDPQDAEAARLLDAADAEIGTLRERGFDTPPIGIIEAAVRWYRGDTAGAGRVLEDMNARGWRIFGMMRFSPLYDDLLADGQDGLPAAIRQAFQPIERDCERIGLAKLGL